MAKIHFLRVCEYAGEDKEDPTKISITRIYEKLELPEIPYSKEDFCVVSEWAGNPGEKFTPSVVIALPDPKADGRIFVVPEVTLPPNGVAFCVSRIQGQNVFTMVGNYRIAVIADNNPAERGILLPVSKIIAH